MKKKILISPLDWGLGHATRCIPIIRELLDNNADVVVASSGGSLALLKAEFPQLSFVSLAGYNIRYAKGGMLLKMLASLPKIVAAIVKEHHQLKRIVKQHKIDAVISDNRYGLWHRKIPSVFITHQLFIKSPFAVGLINRINHFFIKRFTECWVPDWQEKENLSGELSHLQSMLQHCFYIGPLSRFSTLLPSHPNVAPSKYDVMLLLSGPEPQRSIFEDIVMQQIKSTNLKAIVVRGMPEEATQTQEGNISIHSHLPTEAMLEAMMASEMIICRSGYTTLMDLAAVGAKAILVPTHGQTEQEYLALYHQQKKHFYNCNQKGFDLNDALQQSKQYQGIPITAHSSLLKDRITKWLATL